ncbi:MAG: APC family permease [Planctomycetota bacterium]
MQPHREAKVPSHGRLGLLQCVSINMAMMVGSGPFITIPLFIGKMGGPHAIVIWIIGALVAICDGMVWAELSSAFPGAGGTFHFYDQAYGRRPVGRLLKFLFVWQFLFSAPLELASGALGFALYLGYLVPGLDQVVIQWPWPIQIHHFVAVGMMMGVTSMAWRNVKAAGNLMMVLSVGMLFTVGAMITGCLFQADSALIHTTVQQVKDGLGAAAGGDFGLWIGAGGALAIAMYDFLGYYQICYMGEEVHKPEKVIPKSILISVFIIGALYFSMNLSLFAVMPWQDVANSRHIASDAFERLYGLFSGKAMTGLILWTALAATYSAMLGYSRVPYAAARTGHFFKAFSELHPSHAFPHKSLLFLGMAGTLACLMNLETVIAALLTSRIVIQFIGQIVTVIYIRRTPELAAKMKFRMPLFPLPAMIAFLGWSAVFVTSDWPALIYGTLSLVIGLISFMAWNYSTKTNVIVKDAH